MANNFVDDPKTEAGAGAHSGFSGDRDAKRAMRRMAGVVEARPGIIEDTHIEPLNEMTNEDDRGENADRDPSKSSTIDSAKDAVTSAAKEVYEAATARIEKGKEAMHGKTQ